MATPEPERKKSHERGTSGPGIMVHRKGQVLGSAIMVEKAKSSDQLKGVDKNGGVKWHRTHRDRTGLVLSKEFDGWIA